MSTIAHLLREPVTIVPMHPGAPNVYGNREDTPGTAVTTVGYLNQTQSVEYLVDRETYVSDWEAFFPAGTSVGPADRITFGSSTFEVVGVPNTAFNPRIGKDSHVRAQLRVVSG